MSISSLPDKPVSIPTTESPHRYTRKYVEYGLARLNQSDDFTQRVAKYYSDYFKGCPFYDPIDENGQEEPRCSVSGKETTTWYVCHDVPLITGFPGPGLRICLDESNDKVRDTVRAFFKNLHRDMGPYICYTQGPVVDTIWREDIPDLNIPDSQEKHTLYKIGVGYRKEELRIICEVWRRGMTQDFQLSALIRANPSISFRPILDIVIPDSFMGIYIKNALLAKETRHAGGSILKEHPVTVVSKKRKETSVTLPNTSKASPSLAHPSPQIPTIEHSISAEKPESAEDFTSKKPKVAELSSSFLSAQTSSKPSALSKKATVVAREIPIPVKLSSTEPKSGEHTGVFGPFTMRTALDMSNLIKSPWTVKHEGNVLILKRPRLKHEGKHVVNSWVVDRTATIQSGGDLFYIAAPKFQNLSSVVTTRDNEYIIAVHCSADGRDLINAVFT